MTVRILSGDARAILPSLSADVLITDPVWPNARADIVGADRPWELFAEVMALTPVSVRRLVVILRSDSDPRFLAGVPARWRFVCMQALPYAVPMYIGRILGGTEIAYGFGEPVPSREGRRVIPMWAPKITEAKANRRDGLSPGDHPCPRALVHMRWLVNWWSEEGETICDPFCGSGTIPLAAKQLRRHAVGIEIEPRFAERARSRIADDDPLFAEAADD